MLLECNDHSGMTFQRIIVCFFVCFYTILVSIRSSFYMQNITRKEDSIREEDSKTPEPLVDLEGVQINAAPRTPDNKRSHIDTTAEDNPVPVVDLLQSPKRRKQSGNSTPYSRTKCIDFESWHSFANVNQRQYFRNSNGKETYK